MRLLAWSRRPICVPCTLCVFMQLAVRCTCTPERGMSMGKRYRLFHCILSSEGGASEHLSLYFTFPPLGWQAWQKYGSGGPGLSCGMREPKSNSGQSLHSGGITGTKSCVVPMSVL